MEYSRRTVLRAPKIDMHVWRGISGPHQMEVLDLCLPLWVTGVSYVVLLFSWCSFPFKKTCLQCFAILGVSLGMTSTSQVMSFSSVLLPQLRSAQDVDDETASWIASITGISFFFGLMMTPTLMGRYGRRTITLLTSGILTATWCSLLLTTNVTVILLVRFIQGFCLGFAAIIVPVLIGEYSSPKYRGAFLTTMSLAISLGVLCNHTVGAFYSWQTAALVCCLTALVNTIVAILSPESPSYLASCGKYEDCRRAFRWLRYPEEEEELEKMIRTHMVELEGKVSKTFIANLQHKIVNFFVIWKKKEFYKPIIIIFHLHIINEWSGATTFDAYTSDIFHRLVGQDIDVSLMIISTDILRTVSSFCTVLLIRKFLRRLMLLITISSNILSYITIIIYSYAKTHQLIKDYKWIGVFLIHIHVFTFSVGNLCVPNILAGEIFAFEYRGMSNMLAQMFFCLNYIASTKTALHMLKNFNLHGMFGLYVSMVAYGLLVTWFILPETKDKTLQDIEDEFHGRPRETQEVEILNRLFVSK
ncbi:facilitated trehalose transporter Tret1-like [Papilio machaon]|uniref:facilitated trehalose transporter Tret1-like n=1 Tax=Papilio machaon TaxID=76193 RepID=UPI001E666192|nr:facilitated trehalose transporter Tret1-like [Papilio machaon]